MKVKQYLSSILVAASFLYVSPSYAEETVQISSWAKNYVNIFTNDGLLPESLANVSDYQAPITARQFCELLYSVGTKSGRLTDSMIQKSSLWHNNPNTDASLADYILDLTINKSILYYKVFCDDDSHDNSTNQSYDSNCLILREEAADLLARYSSWYGKSYISQLPWGLTYPDASPRAVKGIYTAKVHGLMDAVETPKDYMAIEQAITAVYRMWQNIPDVPHPDGGEIAFSGENLVQIYSNGAEEYKTADSYLIKQNGKVLKEFSLDKYKNIYCTTLDDGRTAAAAQTYDLKTEVYNLSSDTLMFTIDSPSAGMDSEYIITKSSDIGPMTFGLCGYDGTTAAESLYSMDELSYLRQNSFSTPTPSDKANGWIYYCDAEDGNKLYRMEDDGSDKQLLCDNSCFDVKYIDGYLYFSAIDGDTDHLFCMKPDGTGMEQLSSGIGAVCGSSAPGGWVYYIDSSIARQDGCVIFTGPPRLGALWRLKRTDKEIVKEPVDTSYNLCYYENNNDFLYFRNTDTGEGFVLVDGKLEKLETPGIVTYIYTSEQNVIVSVFNPSYSNNTDYFSAPAGSTKFTEFTKDKTYFTKDGIDYSISENLSNDTYQICSSHFIKDDVTKHYTRNVQTKELTEINLPGKILERYENILYSLDNKKLYSYDITNGQHELIADNVLKNISILGDYLIFTDTNRNRECISLKDKTMREVFPNGGIFRNVEPDAFEVDDKTGHLFKRGIDGTYIDLNVSVVNDEVRDYSSYYYESDDYEPNRFVYVAY